MQRRKDNTSTLGLSARANRPFNRAFFNVTFLLIGVVLAIAVMAAVAPTKPNRVATVKRVKHKKPIKKTPQQLPAPVEAKPNTRQLTSRTTQFDQFFQKNIKQSKYRKAAATLFVAHGYYMHCLPNDFEIITAPIVEALSIIMSQPNHRFSQAKWQQLDQFVKTTAAKLPKSLADLYLLMLITEQYFKTTFILPELESAMLAWKNKLTEKPFFSQKMLKVRSRYGLWQPSIVLKKYYAFFAVNVNTQQQQRIMNTYILVYCYYMIEWLEFSLPSIPDDVVIAKKRLIAEKKWRNAEITMQQLGQDELDWQAVQTKLTMTLDSLPYDKAPVVPLMRMLHQKWLMRGLVVENLQQRFDTYELGYKRIAKRYMSRITDNK